MAKIIKIPEKNGWEETQDKKFANKTELVKLPEQSGWGSLPGMGEPTVTHQFDGINELNPFSIKDTYATRTKNLTTSSYPALGVRGGFTPISGISSEIDGIGVRFSELHVIAGGVWRMYKSGAWTTLKSGLSTASKWSFVNFKGGFSVNSLLASNGTDKAMKYDGTSVTDLANAPSKANFICTHDNRVYAASESSVHYSALRKAEDWNTVDESGQIVVETSDGKEITGLVAGSARLTVFKENSIHELFGTNPKNYTMKIVTENLGSPTGHSAQVIDGVMYFLGNDAIYKYSGGALPNSDFSVQVRETVKRINKAYAKNSVSWSIGAIYYLAVPLDGATKPNTVLEFDTLFNTWNIWSFPYNVTAKGAVMDGYAYIGFSGGQLMKLDGKAANDNGVPIEWEWVSKPLTATSIAAKTRWYRLWISAEIQAGSSLTISLSEKEEGESWVDVFTSTPAAETQSKEILVPPNLLFHHHWVRIRLKGTGKSVVHEITRQTRTFPFGQG